jgi:hypothetical protein
MEPVDRRDWAATDTPLLGFRRQPNLLDERGFQPGFVASDLYFRSAIQIQVASLAGV